MTGGDRGVALLAADKHRADAVESGECGYEHEDVGYRPGRVDAVEHGGGLLAVKIKCPGQQRNTERE